MEEMRAGLKAYCCLYKEISESAKQKIVGRVLNLEITKAEAYVEYIISKIFYNYGSAIIIPIVSLLWKKGRPPKECCNDGRGKEKDE